jgi:hypothetical protein
MIYRAHIEFSTSEQTRIRISRITTILYAADDARDAVRSACRFWISRNYVIPEHFARLGCIQVMEIEPRRIDDDGTYNSDEKRLAFEWKELTVFGPAVTIGANLGVYIFT